MFSWRRNESRRLDRISPQAEVIEKLLRHCGLWQVTAVRAPRCVDGLAHDLDDCSGDSPSGSSDKAGELLYVDIDTFQTPY